MKNKDVADILTRMGTLLEIKGELVFKIRAYFKAAENIAQLGEDIEVVKSENRLDDIPGVGKTLRDKIVEYLDTGRMSAYEKLIKDIPESILDVIHIPSVGPKKAKLFFDELKIASVDGLKKAAETGALLKLPLIKEKTVQNILKGIRIVQEGQTRMNLGKATQTADEIIASLKKLKCVQQIEAAGSLRRGKETIGDIDILAAASDPKKVMEVFVQLPQVTSVTAHGETKSSIRIGENTQVDLRIVDEKIFGAALLYFTGSKNFNIKLRQVAIKQGLKISEYGVFKESKEGREQLLASQTEKDCLKTLGLPFIPPQLREELGLERVFGGDPLPKLVEQKDICGDLHVHSTWSDGRNTIEEMAETAHKMGYKYLAISDHSPKLRVAGGVSPEDLLKKKKEIDRLNRKYKDFRILFGSEVEIDSDGNLDYNDQILSEFDIVIAAIHSGFEQPAQQLTKRLLKACQNKYVNIIAHPTGVHLGKREPYDVDFKAVCKAAVDHNVFLEINAFPVRLDLNTSNVYFAKEQGVHFVVNTDAHKVDHLEFMKFGISIAKRGWLTAKDIINTQSLTQLQKSLKKK